MKPRSTEKPVANTPNTPAARSPSLKWLPSGARRRANSISTMATVVVPTMIRTATTRFIERPRLRSPGRPAGGRRGRRSSSGRDLRLRLVVGGLGDHVLALQIFQIRQLVRRARLRHLALDVLTGS